MVRLQGLRRRSRLHLLREMVIAGAAFGRSALQTPTNRQRVHIFCPKGSLVVLVNALPFENNFKSSYLGRHEFGSTAKCARA